VDRVRVEPATSQLQVRYSTYRPVDHRTYLAECDLLAIATFLVPLLLAANMANKDIVLCCIKRDRPVDCRYRW